MYVCILSVPDKEQLNYVKGSICMQNGYTALHLAKSDGVVLLLKKVLLKVLHHKAYSMHVRVIVCILSMHVCVFKLRDCVVSVCLFVVKAGEWKRVGSLVQFLHMSGFASHLWSVRHPDPMAAPSASSPSSMAYDSAVRAGPVARRQQRNVLHNRDLCRIISAFIPNT